MSPDNTAREAWQSADQSAMSRGTRIGTAVILLVLAAIAIALFLLTVRGCPAPTPFVQCIYVPDYGRLVEHSPYVREDVKRIRDLFVDPEKGSRGGGAYDEYAVVSGDPLTSQRLQEERIRAFEQSESDDLAIFYISAAGIVDAEGEACLLTSYEEEKGRPLNQLRDLLRQIQSVSASTHLILLDAGMIEADYARGAAINEFAWAVHQLLRTSADDKPLFGENLWVITSNGLFQSSWPSHTRRGTVFAVAIDDALKTFQSEGDPNEPITMGQLYQSICRRCAAMTMQGDLPQQIPLLMRGGHGAIFKSENHPVELAMNQPVIYPRQMVAVEKPADDDDSSSESGDAGKGAGDESGGNDKGVNGESGKTTDEAADESAVSQVAALATPSPLAPLWKLRDELQSRQLGRGFSPVDFAPHIWIRLNDQLVFFDRQVRWGETPDAADLQRITVDLQTLVDLMKSHLPSGDRQYQQALSADVAKRLVASWDEFLKLSAAEAAQPAVSECRDIFARARDYLHSAKTQAIGSNDKIREALEKLTDELATIRPLLELEVLSGSQVGELEKSTLRMREYERTIHGELAKLITDSERPGAEPKPQDVFRMEQVFNALLDCALLGSGPPFGSPDLSTATSGEEAVPAHFLSRESVHAQYRALLKRDLRPADDSPWDWAGEFWTGDPLAATSRARERLKLESTLTSLSGLVPSIEPPEVRLPDRTQDDPATWENRLENCLAEFQKSGSELKAAQEAMDSAVATAEAQRLANWPLAFLLAPRSIHTLDQTRDALFVVAAATVAKPEETISVSFDMNDRRLDTTIIDLDQPQSAREFHLVVEGGEPASVRMELSIDDADRELAQQTAVGVHREDGTDVNFGEPFRFEFQRDDQHRIQPLKLVFQSSAVAANQTRGQIHFRLRLVDSDDARVRMNPRQSIGLTARLPAEDRIELVIEPPRVGRDESIRASLSSHEDEYYKPEVPLKPFANRFRTAAIRVENHSGRSKKIKVEVFAVAPPPSSEVNHVPGRILRATDVGDRTRALGELRRRSLDGKALATSREITLASGASEVLDFRPSPPPADTAGGASPASAAPPGESSIDEGKAVNQGLLFRLHEVEEAHGREGTRDFWLDLRPLPGEELVDAKCQYDPAEALLTVKINARWKAGEPCPVAGGIACTLTSNQGDEFDARQIVRNATTLDEKSLEGELQLRLTRDEFAALDVVPRLYVNINESRGEFIYELSDSDFIGVAHDKPNRRDDGNFLELRQLEARVGDEPTAKVTRAGSFWALKPPDEVFFELLADVNDGASDECLVQLQIKRDTWGEPQLVGRPFMDRDIQYTARVNPDSGALEFRAAIKDHPFRWRSSERAGGTYALTSQLLDRNLEILRGGTTLSQEMRLDRDAPQFDSAKWIVGDSQRGGAVEVKENETVELEIRTADSTGTRVVQLYLDKDNRDEIGETEVVFANAEPAESSEVWRAHMDVKALIEEKSLRIGDNVFYLVLEDRLGNKTDLQKPEGPVRLAISALTPMEIARNEEALIPKHDLSVEVVRLNALGHEIKMEGAPKVLNGEGTEVPFVTTRTDSGTFRIANLPPGEYTIVGESEIRDSISRKLIKLRHEQKIEVKADKAPDPVKLVLEVVEDEDKGD